MNLKVTRSFYGSWASKQFPFKPIEPISAQEARTRKAYYVGEHSSKGSLLRFEKVLDGKTEWVDEYDYWPNGKLKHRRMIKSDGTIVEQNFNKNGNKTP